MVAQHPTSEQGKNNFSPFTSYDNTIRCCKIGGFGSQCQGLVIGGKWTKEKKELCINSLELKIAKLALTIFTKLKEAQTVHLQMDNVTPLTCMAKVGEQRVQN